MKKIKSFLCLITILFISSFIFIKPQVAFAADERLITVGKDAYNITVMSSSKVADIIKVLGEPKLTTVSAFGGYAYTFYTDDNYSNYLYVETNDKDQIVAFASVDPTYKVYDTTTQSYGEKYDYTKNAPLRGHLFSDNSIIKAGYYYNKVLIKSSIPFFDDFEKTYKSNQTKYLKGISEQAVTMYNALSTNLGNKTNLIFSEEYFYINEQLKEFSYSIRKYGNDSKNIYDYFNPIATTSKVSLRTSSAFTLNPLTFAQNAKSQKKTNFGDINIAVFDYDFDTTKDTGVVSCLTIKDGIFERNSNRKDVSLSVSENSKLTLARQYYKTYLTKINNATDEIYADEPVTSPAGSLKAGRLKTDILEAYLNYANAMRAASGLPVFSLADKLIDRAQHKAVLLSYRKLVENLDFSHMPSKPTGVTDEFFLAATGCADKGYLDCTVGESYGENLEQRTYVTVYKSTLKDSINGLIDDRNLVQGTALGHRLSWLSYGNQQIGFGVSPYMTAIEFDGGSTTYSDDIAAWPPNGVTLIENLYDDQFIWSIKFINKKYTVQSNSTVTIKLLNTNEQYSFTSTDTKAKNKKHYLIYHIGQYNSTSGNMLEFYDDNITVDDGLVYEITINNLKDSNNSTVSYTYRTVFKEANPNSNHLKINSLKISVPEGVTKVGENYHIGLDEEVKLSALIDDIEVVEKKLTWESSDPNSISVTQNGIIKVLKKGTKPITITVKNENSKLQASITIIPDFEEKMSLDYNSYQFNNLNESITVKATLSTGREASVVWSSLNKNIAKVENGFITAVSGGYTEITATSEKYGKQTVKIYVAAPVKLADGHKLYVGDLNGDGKFDSTDNTMILSYVNSTDKDKLLVADINSDGKIDSDDVSLLSSFTSLGFHPGAYKKIESVTLDKNNLTLAKNASFTLTAYINPSDTTDSTTLTWSSTNKAVATVDKTGKITAKADGVTTVTVKTSNGKTASCRVVVGTGIGQFLKGDINEDTIVDVLDAREALYIAVGKATATAHILEIGDMDANNKIEANDAVEILRIYLNK